VRSLGLPRRSFNAKPGPVRADIIIASLQNADNLSALKLKGWTDAETTAFVTARKSFGTGDETKQGAKGGGRIPPR
jgi:hypothetical protein